MNSVVIYDAINASGPASKWANDSFDTFKADRQADLGRCELDLNAGALALAVAEIHHPCTGNCESTDSKTRTFLRQKITPLRLWILVCHLKAHPPAHLATY